MAYKILFDGNGSNIIYIVGLGAYVPAKQHDEVMQKWQQAQAEIEALKAGTKGADYSKCGSGSDGLGGYD